MDLVDEQDDVAAGLDLLEHLLEALLEVAAVARPCNQCTEVERVELLVLERLGHLAGRDRLGQALDDSGLADAGLADEHRVVLGAPTEHLHHALGLAVTTDDRIELLLAGELGEVPTELVEDERTRGGVARAATGGGLLGVAALLRTRGARVAGEQLDDLLAHPRQIGAELDEHLCGNALALTDQPEEDVFGADVVVAELKGLTKREFEDLLGPRSEGDVPRGRRTALTDDLLNLLTHGLEGDPQRLERLGGNALALVDQPQKDVFGADVVVVEQARFFLCQDDDSAGPIGKAFKHSECLLGTRAGQCIRRPLDSLRRDGCRPGYNTLIPPSASRTRAMSPSSQNRPPIVPIQPSGWPRSEPTRRRRVALPNGSCESAHCRALDGGRPRAGRGGPARLGDLRQPLPDRDRHAPHLGGRQAHPSGLLDRLGGYGPGLRSARHRRGRPRSGFGRTGASGIALPRRRHGRRHHSTDGAVGERRLGQPPGDSRR